MFIHPQFDPIAFSSAPGRALVRAHVSRRLRDRADARAQPRAQRSRNRAGPTRTSTTCCSTRVIGVVLGGRLGYVLFYKFADYVANPLHMFYVWEGGMSFHGGFLGVIIAMAFFAWRHASPGSPSPISSRRCAPLGLGARAHRQLHQRRALGPSDRRARGRWCSRTSTTCRAIRRSCTSSPSRASCCSRCCGSSRASRVRWARCRACS